MSSSKSDILIRPATKADLPSLCVVQRASVLEIAPAFYPPDVVNRWGRERDVEEYREAMTLGWTYFVAQVADDSRNALGFSSHHMDKGDHHLKGLYVRGTSARQGVGKKLLQAVEDFAKAHGGNSLHVEASLSGEAFYKATYFVEQSRRVCPHGVETVIMKKDL